MYDRGVVGHFRLITADYMRNTENEFSRQGAKYRAARPQWPVEFICHLANLCPRRDLAWDCATGNGQVAVALSSYFAAVEATDISPQQISLAISANNVRYSVEPAERSHLADNSVDLITGGHAPQWVDLDRFYGEVYRVARPGGVLALFGFREASVSADIDRLTEKLVQEILGPYWYEKGKALDDSKFLSMEFPFQEVTIPSFAISLRYSAEMLISLYESYSAAQRYKDATGAPSTDEIREELVSLWGAGMRDISIPIYSRVGIVPNRGV